MGVAAWSGSLLAWEHELSSLKTRLGPVFGRRELRQTGGAFLDGLLSGVARKTGWMMSEHAGFARPWRMQGLLGRNHWDAEALRDVVRAYVVETLGCAEGVLVVDETGFVKKGRRSAWRVSTAARRAGWRTARSVFSWAMPALSARR